ncbi:hypothetical protein MMC13_000477 [Lambiella insularis]|nr:hypothetical protein [Lambiella insularis]
MVRQPYMTRLALGRSAYEPPDWPEGEKPQDMDASQPDNTDSTQQETIVDRSDDYVQHYDTRGHPENRASRSQARQSRRAQNNILETVGVCVSVDKHGRLVPASSISMAKEQSEMNGIRSLINENENGFWLGSAEVAFFALSASCVAGLRLRVEVVLSNSSIASLFINQYLQTFNIFASIPMREVVRMEWRRFGPLKWLFAGVPAAFVFEILDAGRGVVIEEIRDALLNHLGESSLPEKQRRWACRAIYVLEQLLETATLVVISPLQFFSVLQQLDLAPAWPLLPNPARLSLASLSPLLFPPVPQVWSLHSSLIYALGICVSPLPMLIGLRYVISHLDTQLLRYMRLLLPRPDCPDNFSLKAYTEQPNSVVGMAIDHIKHQSSFADEIKKDFHNLMDKISELKARLRNILQASLYPTADSNPRVLAIEECVAYNDYLQRLADQRSRRNHPHNTPSDSSISLAGMLAELPTNLEASTTPSTTPPFPIPSATPSPTTPPNEPPTSTATPSPPLSASTDNEEQLLRALESSNPVQITTRTGSTDTLHMNVEVNGADPGVPVFTSSFSASPRAAAAQPLEVRHVPETQHRLTALTLFASDSLAQHLVSDLINVLRLPVEAYLARSIALAYLTRGALAPSSSAATTAPALGRMVYPRNTWFGAGLQAGGWAGVGVYAGKMALCVGLESVVGFCVWQMGFQVAWWAGRRRFLWGAL